MSYLPNDVSRCNGLDDDPQCKDCRRREPANGNRVVMMRPNPESEYCIYKIEMEPKP